MWSPVPNPLLNKLGFLFSTSHVPGTALDISFLNSRRKVCLREMGFACRVGVKNKNKKTDRFYWCAGGRAHGIPELSVTRDLDAPRPMTRDEGRGGEGAEGAKPQGF